MLQTHSNVWLRSCLYKFIYVDLSSHRRTPWSPMEMRGKEKLQLVLFGRWNHFPIGNRTDRARAKEQIQLKRWYWKAEVAWRKYHWDTCSELWWSVIDVSFLPSTEWQDGILVASFGGPPLTLSIRVVCFVGLHVTTHFCIVTFGPRRWRCYKNH